MKQHEFIRLSLTMSRAKWLDAIQIWTERDEDLIQASHEIIFCRRRVKRQLRKRRQLRSRPVERISTRIAQSCVCKSRISTTFESYPKKDLIHWCDEWYAIFPWSQSQRRRNRGQSEDVELFQVVSPPLHGFSITQYFETKW